jgi:hypothetical protein
LDKYLVKKLNEHNKFKRNRIVMLNIISLNSQKKELLKEISINDSKDEEFYKSKILKSF